MSLNLEKQLCFYGAYHNNRINIGIHMICVPILLGTGLALLTNSPTIIPLPSWMTITYLDLNLGTIAAVIYGGFYLLLEPVVGAILFPLFFGWTAYARHITTNSVHATSFNQNAIILHVVCWVAQFIGHGLFEGRAPALTDSVTQSLLLAPFFVFLEFLFFFGYRPELKNRKDQAVAEELKRVRAAEARKADSRKEN